MTGPDREQVRAQTGIPYDKISELDARRDARVATDFGFVAEMLQATGVPSISPRTAEMMLDSATYIRARVLPVIEAQAAQDPEARHAAQRLGAYLEALEMVVYVAAHHQCAVLDGLHRSLRTAHATDVGLKDPDHLETFVALQKLADLGKKDC